MDEQSKTCPSCGSRLKGRWENRCYQCKGRPRTGETRQCRTCGKDFHAPKWKLDDTARNQGAYCSRECKHEAQLQPPSIPIYMSELPPDSIQCVRCGLAKPAEQFGADTRKRNGKKSACIPCSNESVARWRERYPERYEAMKKVPKTERQKLRRRDRDLQDMYGLTLLDYERMLAGQRGGCAICGGAPNGTARAGNRLHVDHDRRCCPRTGSCGQCIRGLLCGSCNTAIGLMADDPQRLLAAVAYLQRFVAPAT